LSVEGVFEQLPSSYRERYAALLPASANTAAERGRIDQARDHYRRLVKLQPDKGLWKERLEQLKPGVNAVWNFDTGLGSWGLSHDCELSVQKGVLTARTTGDDPSFSTPVSARAGGTAIILRYRTAKPLTLQVFWSDSSGNMGDSRHRDYPIPASAAAWREITLPFWSQGTLNTLRLDLNTARQHPLEIDSIVLRHLEPAATADLWLQLVHQKPDDSLVWLAVAPILAVDENQRAYSDFCGRMAKQFANSKDLEAVERTVKAALLRPNSIDPARLPGKTLDQILDSGMSPDGPAAGWLPWGWAARALWAYRRGDAASAVKYAMKSEESKPQELTRAMNLALVAMAEHQLQHPDRARRVLDEASQLVARRESNPINNDSPNLMIAQILLREAQALVNGKPRPKPAGG